MIPAFVFFGLFFLVSCQPTEIWLGVAIDTPVDNLQSSYLIQTAIEDVNADPTLLPDYQLKYVVVDSVCNSKGGVQNGVDFATGFPNMSAWIGAACSSASIPMAQLGTVFTTPQISYASTNPALSDKARYTYFMRTVGSDLYQANAFVALCQRYGWRRVVTLNSQEEIHTLIISAFIKSAVAAGIEVVASASFPGTAQNEPRSQLATLRATGCTIIVMSCYVRDAHTVIRLASEINMVGQPYMWVGSDSWIGSAVAQPFLAADGSDDNCSVCLQNFGNLSNYKEWTQGMIGFVPDPKLNALGLQKQSQLLANQSLTQGEVFTYGFFGYDSVYVIARSLQTLLYNSTQVFNPSAPSVTFKAALYDEMRRQQITGITGAIAFDEFGDRLVPYLIYLMNYLSDGTFGVEQVHTWDPLTLLWTDSLITNITWPGNETVIVPIDSYPYTITTISEGLKWAFIALAAVAICIGLIVFVLLIVYWNHERIKAATPIFLAVILFSTLLTESIVFVIAVYPTDATCTIPHWFGHVSFFAVFSCLFFKTFRIWRIWQFKWGASLKKAKSKKMKDSFGLKQIHLLIMVCLCVFAILVYLAIFTGVDHPVAILEQDDTNPLNFIAKCEATFAWVLPIYIVEIVLLIFNVIICWQIRKVELLRFNESSHISICIYALILIGIILIPQVLWLTSDINTLFVLESVCIIIAGVTVQGAIFFPKFKAIILKEKETLDSMSSGMSNSSRSTRDVSSSKG